METNTEKYALVTGGTTGIGYELAKLLAKNEYNLVIVARKEDELAMAADDFERYGVKVMTISKDLFNPLNAFVLHEQVSERGIRIDVLVNDAGQGQYGEFIDTDIRRELDIIQLNIASVVVLTKLFLREMVERGDGKILNVSSIASKLPGPLQSVYHGTKAFVQSFTEAVREEVKDTGVTVTALLPGETATDFFNKADMLNAKNFQEGELSDARQVAQDGYDALMRGDDMVVSGVTNKMKIAMASVTPDAALAKKVHKNQAPVTDDRK
jgi:short-subunit dehydrogenase